MHNVHDLLLNQVEVFKRFSFKDLLFVHYRCPQLEKYASLYSHHNYILYALSGRKIYFMPGKSIMLEQGSCAFVKKGGYVQERFFDLDWIVLAFFIPENYLKQFIHEYRLYFQRQQQTPVIPLEIFTPLHVNEISSVFFDSILLYFMEPAAPPEMVIELKFRELLLNLLSDPANAPLVRHLLQLSDAEKPLLGEIMEENFMHHLSLDDYARISQRSLAGFKREFTALFKMSPGKWLAGKRLLYAQLLLETSTKNINEIADSSGFENTSHFSRVFKDKFGVAPLRYRLQYQRMS